MATPLFNAFVTKIRDWSNRDAVALPDTVIADAMRFAADESYRRLKIPALEQNQYYYVYGNDTDGNVIDTIPAVVTAAYPNVVGVTAERITALSVIRTLLLKLAVPADTTQFIHLRNIGPEGNEFAGMGIVFNEKIDVRTFYDSTAHVRDINRWTRQGPELLVAGEFNGGDVIELFYYRRLLAQDARYDVNALNYLAKFIVTSAVTGSTDFPPSTTNLGDQTPLFFPANTTPALVTEDLAKSPPILAPTAAATATNTVEIFLTGSEVPNWLRDQNLRALLFGALMECFDYLSDIENRQLYESKFESAIEELNEEEKRRMASGGNVQVNYSSYLLSYRN